MQARAAVHPGFAAVLTSLAVLAGACASTGTPRPLTPASIGRPVADAPAEDAAPRAAAEAPAPPAAAAPPPVVETAPIPAPRTAKTSRAIVETALKLRGVRYRAGGTEPRTGFDCSGFTRYVFARHGIDLPRSVAEQVHEGKSIKRREIAAGDLLFFKTEGKVANHVAISIDGEQFVHAPSSNGVVRVESLDTTYWSSRFISARRIK